MTGLVIWIHTAKVDSLVNRLSDQHLTSMYVCVSLGAYTDDEWFKQATAPKVKSSNLPICLFARILLRITWCLEQNPSMHR
jgi:hypothetical protein